MSVKQIQSVSNFSGGFNSRDSSLSLKNNESGSMYNCYPGSTKTTPREGTTRFSTTQFSGEVTYTIAFENDNFKKTIIAFLQDGRIQAIIKDNPNVIDIGNTGTNAPNYENISHLIADKAIFVFSKKQEYNLIIEQDIFVSGIDNTPLTPYFSIRNNFLHNFGDLNPNNDKSYWFLEAVGASEIGDPTLVPRTATDLPNTENSDNVGKESRIKECMFLGYAIGYVRRTDAKAFESDGVTPKETIIYAAGASESNYDPRTNVRIAGLRKTPLNLQDDFEKYSGYFEEIAFDSLSAVSVKEGSYVWDKKNGLLYRAIVDTNNRYKNVHDKDHFVLDTFSDKAGVNDAPNLRVYIPNNTEAVYNLSGSAAQDASRLRVKNISDVCHPLNNGKYDEQITHIRIYRTLQATSFEAAKGNSYRFLVDLPIDYLTKSGKAYYIDTTTDAELTGSDNTLTFWGTTPAPLCKYSKYHNGRIWVGGEENFPGRAWYSKFPQDATAIRKYLTHFSPDINWIDCNQDTGDPMRGIAETNDQLIFLMKKSVWGLFRGSPEGSGPQKLTTTRGCYSDNSVTQVDKTVFFISQEGPAAVSGREVQLIENFKAGEFWSLQGNPQQKNSMAGKNVFKIDESTLKTLRAWYHEETWFLSYRYSYKGQTKWICIGFYISDINEGMGAWELQFAVPSLQQITNIAQWDSANAAFLTKGTNFSYNFLDSSAIDDIGIQFYVGAKSRRFYANPDRRERYGNLWDIMIYAQYKDAEDMEILVYVDQDNIIANNTYSTSIIDNVGRPVASRHNIQFAFPEGVFGQFFEVEWIKKFDTDFDMYGFDMRYYLVEGGAPRFASTDGEILVDVSEDGVGSMPLNGSCQPFIVGPRP